jgi:hypothetical protein
VVVGLVLGLGSVCAQGVKIPLSPPPEAFPDAADQVVWPQRGYPVFAAGSAGHVGDWLFDAPAGKHGHVQTMPDGSLAFADGTPARFWGTTTVYGTTFPDKPEEIPQLADAIAARGYNLVRFHHNDVTWNGIGFAANSPEKTNGAVNPEMMDRLDRFAAELIKRGIYLYVDLIDSRELLPGDGILEQFPDLNPKEQGWKGVFPHPAVVAAWKKAADAFLTHKNPYTGRTWAEEPAVVTVEIINENGVFWDWSFKVSDSVTRWYDAAWNAWLLQKYGSREKLAATWTDANGVCGLFPDEDPAKGNVYRPRLVPLLDWNRPYRSKTRGAARINDYYTHLAETARAFYGGAVEHLRGLGYQGVILGSHELQGPINRYAETAAGSVGAHLYARPMPAWYARPSSGGSVTEGVDVKTTNWFSNIPRIKVDGLSSINGEWAAGAMMFRADANVAVAAATAFQGVDQSLHFSYAHRWARVRMPNYDTLYDYQAYRKAIGMTFSSSHDIPWMVVNRVCAPLFIRGDLAKPRYKVHIAYSDADVREQNLHALGLNGGNGTVGDAALFLPLLHDVESSFFDTVYEGNADVVFTTGRSASGDYRRAKHAVIVGDNPWCDPYHKTRDLGRPARTVWPQLKTADLKQVEFTVSWPYAEPRVLRYASYEGAIETSSLPAGAQAIGRSADGTHCLGWLDDKYLVLPNGRAFGRQIGDQRWLYRLYLAAAKRWGIDTGPNSADADFYQADTGELTVDWGHGTLVLDTPRTQGFSGLPGWRPENRTRDLTCTLDAPYGNVLVTSCSTDAIPEAKRLLLVATARMKNTDQEIAMKANGRAELRKTGKGPCIVEALRGTVSIRTKTPMVVYALDHEGNRRGVVQSTRQGELTSFELSPKWQSIWFELAAAGVDAPAKLATTWPAEVSPRENPIPQPDLVDLGEYLASASGKAGEETEAAEAEEGDLRVPLADFAGKLPMGGYGNFSSTQVNDLNHGKVLQGQFGKVNAKDWHGGFWMNLVTPTGLKQEDVSAFGIRFKGDGTMPRDTFITVTTRGGFRYKGKKNRHEIFESDSWNDILLTSSDFTLDKKKEGAPPEPDLSQVERLDFVCVGPLMSNQHMGRFAEVFLVAKRRPAGGNPFQVELPSPAPAKTQSILIPYLRGTSPIKADGVIEEEAWTKSFALAMEEAQVPDWHYFGSFVVAGKRANDERADFWLLGTDAGLAMIARVDKGGKPVVAEKKDWYYNDCVEVFSDPSLKGSKPFTQLFLAYRTSNVDLPGASKGEIAVGRAKVQEGYLLEAVIPWKLLGVEDPTKEFGLELQVDVAAAGAGRVLQMVYATGTNEAWISAKHYLRARCVPAE